MPVTAAGTPVVAQQAEFGSVCQVGVPPPPMYGFGFMGGSSSGCLGGGGGSGTCSLVSVVGLAVLLMKDHFPVRSDAYYQDALDG